MNPKAVGEKTEGMILAHLLQKDIPVSLPFGNNQRYDMVVEENGKLLRVQCKTGRLKSGCVSFWACSTNGFTGEKRSYRGQVDLFMIYCPENGKFYRVPVDVGGKTNVTLRIEAPKNVANHFNWASEYEF